MFKKSLTLRDMVLASCLAVSSVALAAPNDKIDGKASFANGSALRTLDIKGTEKAKNGGNGKVFYTDTVSGSFVATITTLNIVEDTAWIAARIDLASNSAWAGKWVFMKVVDGGKNGTDYVWMGLADETGAVKDVIDMLDPSEGAFKVIKGDLKIKGH